MSQTVIVTTPEDLERLMTRLLAPLKTQALTPEAAELEKLRRKEYLTTEEVEKLYNINANTLRKRRVNGEGPAYVKDGERVLYASKAVSQYLESRRQKTHDQE